MISGFPALYTDHLLMLSLTIVLWAAVAKKITIVQSFFAVFSAVIAWIVGTLIKAVFWLPRPYLTSGNEPQVGFLLDGSFPSNHALFAYSLAFSVLIFNRRLGMLLLLVAFLVSAGRVQAHVHSGVDVLGAFVLGYLLVWVSKRLVYPKLLG